MAYASPRSSGFFLIASQLDGEVFSLLPPPQHDLADLRVQVGAAAGQGTSVTVYVGDHREQKWVGGEVVQGGSAVQALKQVFSFPSGADGDVLVGRPGAMAFRRQIPAVHEPAYLLRSETADLEYFRAVDLRGAVAMRP